MAKYLITGPLEIAGQRTGAVVELGSDINVAALVDEGHVVRVPVKPAVKFRKGVD